MFWARVSLASGFLQHLGLSRGNVSGYQDWGRLEQGGPVGRGGEGRGEETAQGEPYPPHGEK